METRFGHSLYEALSQDVCSFGYSGVFRDDHTARLIALGSSALALQGIEGQVHGKLAFIMVEAYQNIIRHRPSLAAGPLEGPGRSIFLLRCQERVQHVLATNPVRREVVPALEATLRDLDGLDRESLKGLFLSGLQKAADPQRRGAGLGFIEMTRRSGNPLEHRFDPVDASHMRFSLAVKLGTAPQATPVIDQMPWITSSVIEHDIRFFQSGVRTSATEEAMLRLVEEDDSLGGLQGVLAALAAVSPTGALATEGVFILAGPASSSTLISGAVLPPKEAAELGEELRGLATWGRTELEQRYGTGSTDVRPGLLELAYLSQGPLEHMSVAVGNGALVLVRAALRPRSSHLL